MRKGDLVRFKKLPIIAARKGIFGFDEAEEWVVGLLVEYHTWEKVATVLYEGEIYRIRASDVQKAGKKDIEKKNNLINNERFAYE